MAEVKTDSVGNPAIAGAKAAAREFIDGFETGTSTFNEIGGNNLRNGDAAVINQIRQNRRDAKKAYEKLDEL
ncbi:hypothetical protein [Pseudomonas yamanorum]|uniref:hypothetical protein n=1 Tax=Pseudomonas yamanorum TaxID=515393 RepID=UPI00087923FD|nr:hypothetical protein [Pseudomonas yamanorum]SDU32538.1 hypothetical protein SAMN05216237_4291 [Pseudomonas yamanorum]